ncbi:hypothetical protein ACIPY0_20325 [Paenarthrobacter nicotinovorans]|uniref:hypothetical protein n=1 Tax=Paenarthrobacter nicotinovorans TaxID=29320 RepID=UPI00380F196E
MSGFVPDPYLLDKWWERRQKVELARGEYVIRAKDAAQFQQQEERFDLAETIERAGQHGPSTVECLRLKDAEYYAGAILADGYHKTPRAMDIDAEEQLIECLFRGYKTLGFDTDGDKTGMQMLSRAGLGGNNLAEFIRIMDRAFIQAREDMDGAE